MSRLLRKRFAASGLGFRIGIERTGEYGVHDAKQIGLVARESRIAAFADVDLWEIAAWLDTVSVVFRTLLPKCLGQERLARHMVTIGLHVREHGAAMNAPSLLTFVTVVLNKQQWHEPSAATEVYRIRANTANRCAVGLPLDVVGVAETSSPTTGGGLEPHSD